MYRKLEVPPGTVPLPVACARLRVSWTRGFRLVLVGELEGRRVGSRWYVVEHSLRRMLERAERGEDVVMDRRKWRPRGPDGRYLAGRTAEVPAATS